MAPYLRIQRKDSLVVDGTPSHFQGDRTLGFVEWNWDGQTLTVRNDRLGFRPLYYFHDDAGVGVSTSLLKLLELGAPRALDDTAMAVFLRLGYFLGEDTPFQAIRALPPNAELTWADGKLKLQFEYIRPPRLELSADEVVDAYNAAVRRAFAAVLPKSNNVVVPLSGGRDSRNIFLELLAQGVRPRHAVTLRHFPPRADEDVRVAALLCQAAGVEHVILDQSADLLAAERRKNLLTEFCASWHSWTLPMVDYVAQAGYERLYDGIGGDVFLEGHLWAPPLIRAYAERDFEALAQELLEGEGFLPRVLTADAYRRFSRDRAVVRLKRELALHADAPNPNSTFQFWNRTRRHVALCPFVMLEPACEVSSPFLVPSLVDFLLGLPHALVGDRLLRTRAFARAYPQFASIPFERKDAPLNLDYRSLRRTAGGLLRSSLTASKFVRPAAVAIRALRAFAQPSYGPEVVGLSDSVTYLLQLDELIR